MRESADSLAVPEADGMRRRSPAVRRRTMSSLSEDSSLCEREWALFMEDEFGAGFR